MIPFGTIGSVEVTERVLCRSLMMPQIETMTKMAMMPQNIVLRPSDAFSWSMLQRYLMSPQKKTTIASVINSPMTPFKIVLTNISVSLIVCALARKGSSALAAARDETAIRLCIKIAFAIISLYKVAPS